MKYLTWIKEKLVARADFYQLWNGKRTTPYRNLTDEVLNKHITGEEIVVLYAANLEQNCRAVMLDIDNHCPTHDLSAENEALALGIWEKAKEYRPLVEQSSPGGFHIWIVWNDWCPAAAAFDLGMSLGGFVIPNNKSISPRYWGAAYRLPGPRSPRQGTLSQFWDGSKWLEWGAAAIDYITSFNGVDPPVKRLDAKPVAKTAAASRGFGDTIAKMTAGVGIKPCGGCKKRQDMLNKLFPYKEAN